MRGRGTGQGATVANVGGSTGGTMSGQGTGVGTGGGPGEGTGEGTSGGGGTAFYRAADASLEPLRGEVVGVLGYGNLGRSVALNLRDSGVEVVVGGIDDRFRRAAAEEGFPVLDLGEAAARADVVAVMLPDEVIGAVVRDQVAPRLAPGSALCFASGYALAHGLVTPPPQVDVLLLAPRMVGEEVRTTYVDGSGFLSYVDVEQDATGRAEERLLALALAVGSLQRGAMRLSARQEAELDLFVEQAVGPYLGVAFQLAFAIGVEAGLPPEALVAELYLSGEMPRTIATMGSLGFFESVRSHGLVAAYGGLLGTMDLDRDAMEDHFRRVLEGIRSGAFAQRLQEEEAQGYPVLAVLEGVLAGGDPMTAAERRFRDGLGLPQPPHASRSGAAAAEEADRGGPASGAGPAAAAPPAGPTADRPGGGTTAAPGAGPSARR